MTIDYSCPIDEAAIAVRVPTVPRKAGWRHPLAEMFLTQPKARLTWSGTLLALHALGDIQRLRTPAHFGPLPA